MPWEGVTFRLVDPYELGPWSRQMRQRTQVTSLDVAEAMGCNYTQVCAWERGSTLPNLVTSLSLVEVHGFSVVLVKKGFGRGL